MRKNFILALFLILFAVNFEVLNATEYQKPSWKSDYSVEEKVEKDQDEETVRTISSGTQAENLQDVAQENLKEEKEVESWKFIPLTED